MLLILMILAVMSRFATNFSNWKIALALTFVFLLFAHWADNPPSNANLIVAILVSPAAYGVIHLFLIPLGWLKSKIMRPAWGRT
jgi:hypothetical protein